MNKEKLIYLMGSFFLALGVMSLTIIPIIMNMGEALLLSDTSDFVLISFIFFGLGTGLYFFSYKYYQKQLAWFFALMIYYVIFQLLFLLSNQVAV